MIQSYAQRVKEDVGIVYQGIANNQIGKSREQDIRIGLAATRIFAACAMVSIAILSIAPLTLLAVKPLAATATLVVHTVAFVLAHDIFIVCKNQTAIDEFEPEAFENIAKSGAETVRKTAREGWKFAINWLKGKENAAVENIAEKCFSHHILEGTIAKDLWNPLLTRLNILIMKNEMAKR